MVFVCFPWKPWILKNKTKTTTVGLTMVFPGGAVPGMPPCFKKTLVGSSLPPSATGAVEKTGWNCFFVLPVSRAQSQTIRPDPDETRSWTATPFVVFFSFFLFHFLYIVYLHVLFKAAAVIQKDRNHFSYPFSTFSLKSRFDITPSSTECKHICVQKESLRTNRNQMANCYRKEHMERKNEEAE